MLDQNGAERQGNRLQSKSGPKRSCNRSGTVPECKRPKKTGPYQSSPVFSLFGNLPEPVRVRLPSWDAKKPDRTGLSNTSFIHQINLITTRPFPSHSLQPIFTLPLDL